MKPRNAPSLAYLTGWYPAVRVTFILREVLRMRELGWNVRTASISPPERGADGFSEVEMHEVASTFYVKARGWRRGLADHAACLARRPVRYAAGLALALRLAGADPKALVYHCAYFAEAVVVGEWMRRNALDHLHVHFANASATVALMVRKIYGIPYSITVHGSDEFYDFRFYRLRRKIEGASFLRCVSSFTRSQLMKAGRPEDWDKLEVCALGVDPDVFQPVPRRAGRPFSILCTAGLATAKGQRILLDAVAELRGRGRQVRLDLIGDGPDRAALERAAARLNIAADVHFQGSAGQARVREFLADADVFVLPSFAEGVPVCLMEAMAMEVACVATYVGGIPELIDSGRDGILVPPSDAVRLADAIETLMDDAGLRLSLGRAGRRKVIEKYNLGPNVEKLAAMFSRRLPAAPEARAAETA